MYCTVNWISFQVNTQAPEEITDCSNPKNSKYYVVVVQVNNKCKAQDLLQLFFCQKSSHVLSCDFVQYMARLNAESIKNFLYALNDKKVPKKRFNSESHIIASIHLHKIDWGISFAQSVLRSVIYRLSTSMIHQMPPCAIAKPWSSGLPLTCPCIANLIMQLYRISVIHLACTIP